MGGIILVMPRLSLQWRSCELRPFLRLPWAKARVFVWNRFGSGRRMGPAEKLRDGCSIKLNNFNEDYLIRGTSMGVKSFSITDSVYEKYSAECKRLGLNMSKQIENFMKFQLEEEFAVREEYIEKLAKIRKERFTPVADFEKHFKESV